MAEQSVRVGVLSFHNSKETKAILNAVEALGGAPEWLREENLLFAVDGDGCRLEPDADVIVNRVLLSNTAQPAERLGIANTIAQVRPTLNEPAATALAGHKLAAAAVLVREGIRVPETVFSLSADRLDARRDAFGEEAVYKTAIGTHGGGAWRVGYADQVTGKVGQRHAFLQRFIGREGAPTRDLRVYVVGGEIVGAMFRYAPEDEWRTNVALGGSVEEASDELTDEVADTARRAAAAFGLDYAGVDLIEGEDGWYVLEVNPTAGFKGLYAATGRSPAPYIARLAIERAGGDVDPDRVRELAATLDDSWPACAPVPEDDAAPPIVIGLTEHVVVSGTTGTERVIAKADTGATTTSIDIGLAADVGAGPIHKVARVRSGSSKRSRPRPVVDLVVGIGGTQHTVAANIEDRSHMDYPLLLGRDVLRHYRLDVSRRIDDGELGVE